jgi:hypothetical protein
MAAQMGLSLIPVTIAAGQSLSPQVDIGPGQLVGIYIPASWTVASPTFQVSPDGGVTWYEHISYTGSPTVFGYDSGVAAYLAVDPTLWQGALSLKIRSGVVGAPVAQVSTVTLQLACKVN